PAPPRWGEPARRRSWSRAPPPRSRRTPKRAPYSRAAQASSVPPPKRRALRRRRRTSARSTSPPLRSRGVEGSQFQVTRQEAPVPQTATASAPSRQGSGASTSSSSSTATDASHSSVSQAAQQAQVGGGDQTQIVEQDSGDDTVGKSRAFPTKAPAAHSELALPNGRPLAGAPGATEGPRHTEGASSQRAPREPSKPGPQDSSLLGAPGNAAGGLSLAAFAALLIPFFLTALWWARRYHPAAFRRLLGVVLRLERPG